MSTECINCHLDLAEGDAFCRHCGTKAPTPPGPCPSCGRVNQEDARFCVDCGTPVVPDARPAAAATPGAPAAPEPASSAEVVAAPAAAPVAPVVDTDAAAAAAPPEAVLPPAAAPVAPVVESPAAAGDTTAQMPAAEAAPPTAPTTAVPAVGAAATASAATSSTSTTKTLTLVGAAAAAVGTFLPWLSANGDSANGFDVPVNFLIDYETTASHDFSAGLIVLALAVAAGLAVLQPKAASRIPLLPVGVVILVVAGAYLGQLWRLTDDFGVSFTDYLGLGSIIAAVGGALILTRK